MRYATTRICISKPHLCFFEKETPKSTRASGMNKILTSGLDRSQIQFCKILISRNSQTQNNNLERRATEVQGPQRAKFSWVMKTDKAVSINKRGHHPFASRAATPQLNIITHNFCLSSKLKYVWIFALKLHMWPC